MNKYEPSAVEGVCDLPLLEVQDLPPVHNEQGDSREAPSPTLRGVRGFVARHRMAMSVAAHWVFFALALLAAFALA